MLHTHTTLRLTAAGLAPRLVNIIFWAVWIDYTTGQSGQTPKRSTQKQVERDLGEVLEDYPEAEFWLKDSSTQQ